MNTDSSLRSSRLPEGFVFTGTLFALGQLAAQTPAAPAATEKKEEQKSENMGEMVVQADLEKSLYKPERLQSPKLNQPLRDIAQTVTVIPQEVIKDQGASNLRDVLRNVPGISMQAGEGGGGLPGDNLSIRGFNSRNDIFVDGVRDGGSFSRDPFNIEQVEVFKGPSSSNSGRGSTGGSINLASKVPQLRRFTDITLGGGTDDYGRFTFDTNQSLEDWIGCAAFRLNGVYHTADMPGRDVVSEERWGIAPSIAFGLGTDTRFKVSYYHLQQDNTPDYGIPWVPAPSTAAGVTTTYLNGLGNFINQPAPVPYSNFYGIDGYDFEHVQNDLLTATFEHDFSEKVKLQNTTRFGRTDRDSAITAPRFADVDPAAGNITYDGTINRQLQRREMISEFFTNVLNVNIDFETGALEHSVATGAEVTLERQKNRNSAQNTNQPQTNIFYPNPNDLPLGPMPAITTPFVESHLDTIAFYAFDTINVGEHWEFNGGARYDHLEADSGPIANDDDLISWRAAAIYKPVEYGSVYFAYGTSFNPSIDANTGLGLTAATASLEPEESETFELGTKWDLLDEKLGLTAAIFHTEKTNARTPALAGGGTVLAGNQTVDGIEFGVVGNITDNWQVLAGYTYMESETEESNTAAEVGQALGNTPDHSVSLWTNVDITDKLNAGIGGSYVGDRRNGNGATARTAPDYITVDAMAGYEITDWCTVRLNVYNMFDEQYIDRVGGGHFIPGAGRAAVLSTTFTF